MTQGHLGVCVWWHFHPHELWLGMDSPGGWWAERRLAQTLGLQLQRPVDLIASPKGSNIPEQPSLDPPWGWVPHFGSAQPQPCHSLTVAVLGSSPGPSPPAPAIAAGGGDSPRQSLPAGCGGPIFS